MTTGTDAITFGDIGTGEGVGRVAAESVVEEGVDAAGTEDRKRAFMVSFLAT